MDHKSKEHHQEEALSPSTLTVENVIKFELQYESVDEDLLERRKVEEYIKNTQQFEQQQKDTYTLWPEKDLKSSTDGTSEEFYAEGSEKEMQIDSETKDKGSQVPIVTEERKQKENAEKVQYKSVQTQTEWNSSVLSPAMSRNDLVTSVTTLESNSVHSADGEDPGSAEMTLNVEEVPLEEASEDLGSCDFCLKPRKPFPSVKQLIYEPSSTLFCCVKSQQVFQVMIMDAIETHTPEDADKLISEGEAQDTNNKEEFEEKPSNDLPLTPPHSSDMIKALNTLREGLKKVNTKGYITALSHHLKSYGTLFMIEKITFSLDNTAYNNTTCMQSAAPNFDQAPNIDDFFCPVLDSRLVKMPKIVCEFYNSGSSFLILFTDGTGQVLYPSGNIGISIARSKSAQLTFIIMEDAKQKPQIQAVFMSNGHAACYHSNGRLWVVLDPYGGFCFDENGTLQKRWAWWDFSRHVHAPPFQPITLKLNSNIEVKILTQDRIFLTFTSEKEKVTFNVGAKLMLKDPDSLFQLKSSAADAECYLCSKHLQINILFNNIRDLLRISFSSHSTMETMQKLVMQLQKSLDYITGLASKLSESAEKQKNKSIQQNVTAVKKKLPPYRTPALKIEFNA